MMKIKHINYYDRQNYIWCNSSHITEKGEKEDTKKDDTKIFFFADAN